MILPVGDLKKYSLVAEHMRVLQLFDIDKVLLQKKNVLRVQHARLHREQLFCLLFVTFSHHPMRTFPNLLPNIVNVLESLFVIGLRFGLTFRIR